jgi:hypothetical protein
LFALEFASCKHCPLRIAADRRPCREWRLLAYCVEKLASLPGRAGLTECLPAKAPHREQRSPFGLPQNRVLNFHGDFRVAEFFKK